MSTLEGQQLGTKDVLRIEYKNVIEAVDELIRPPETDLFLAPGFIDIQVNGFGGVDYNDPAASHDAIARSIRLMFRTGVTRFLPTIITSAHDRAVRALENLAAFVETDSIEAQAIAGFHMEGPHISPEDGPRGAHPLQHVRPPDIREFETWQEASRGRVRLVTLSPEWPETPGYVKHVHGAGTVVSVGHTKASSTQIRAAVDAGATLSTHLGNGAHAILPKTDNYIWDQLVEDRLTAGFVVDGIHIPSAFLRAALRSKGLERALLVTDAVMPAMCKPGAYRLGEVVVELHANGSVTLRDGTRLAGSALRMDRAIGNVVRLGGITLREAISMATVTPARAARISGRQRGLTPGEKADVVQFTWDSKQSLLAVVRTVVAGQEVYRASANDGVSTE